MLERKSNCGLSFSLIAAMLVAGAQLSCSAQDAAPSARVIQMVNLYANLQKTIDGKKSKAGDQVSARVTVGATLSDGTVVPTGSILSGHIDSITPAENRGDSILVLTLDKLDVKNHKELPVRAVIMKVSTLALNFGQEQANNDPEANRPSSAPDKAPNGDGIIDHPPPSNNIEPHPIPGLTLSGSASEPDSGTLTQEKKNIHLTNNTQLIISVAIVHQS
jgi:hypothetical protein